MPFILEWQSELALRAHDFITSTPSRTLNALFSKRV